MVGRAEAKGFDPDQIDALVDTIPFESMLSDAADAVYGSLVQGVPSLVEYLDEGQRSVEDVLAEGGIVKTCGLACLTPLSDDLLVDLDRRVVRQACR